MFFNVHQDLQRAQHNHVVGTFSPEIRNFLNVERVIERSVSKGSCNDTYNILVYLKRLSKDQRFEGLHEEINILMAKMVFELTNPKEMPIYKFCSEALRKVNLGYSGPSLRKTMLIAYANCLKGIIIKHKSFKYPEGSDTSKFLLQMSTRIFNRAKLGSQQLNQYNSLEQIFNKLFNRMESFYKNTKVVVLEEAMSRAPFKAWRDVVGDRLKKSKTKILTDTFYGIGTGVPNKSYWIQLITDLGGEMVSSDRSWTNNDWDMSHGYYFIGWKPRPGTKEVAEFILQTTFLNLINDLL